ncbi:helix-turn-helix domain-containing protein [Streptomyces niveus]|uniref:helix-turn-helix domain-containing protein n=1 Tax=Streptomyces niveus TaxID=193462 RepID=UPI00364720AD
MVRSPLTPEERERGERLGRLLREARGSRSMVEIAAVAGLSPETLRKIETGRAPTPAFFTVAALAGALGLSMDEIAAACSPLAADGLPTHPPAADASATTGGIDSRSPAAA